MESKLTPTDIITFWYAKRMRSQWFSSTIELDKEIVEKFETTWNSAASGELDAWLATPEG